MTTEEPLISEYLASHFSQFQSELKAELSSHATIRQIKAGENMLLTGQYLRSTMLIAEGRIKLFREGDEGEEFFMYYLEPGDACALSIICAENKQRSGIIAKAVEDTTVISVPVAIMDHLMRNYKSWYHFVIETFRTRFNELLEVIDNIAFRAMDERLEFYLKKQVKELRVTKLKMTHQEIANDLGTSREVISRLLKKMEDSGKVALHKNHIDWIG
ncbi:MAG: Crp/Fnr family transcriptional regulator [Bacteroidetes bacterium]|nr:MAG: Crp/Fnr family transcriptional regulator [Bacteroidota bacterium]